MWKVYGNGDRDTVMDHAWRILYATDFRSGQVIKAVEHDDDEDRNSRAPYRLVLASGEEGGAA